MNSKNTLGNTSESIAFSLPMRTRFRGINVREGLLVKGEVGWAEWSPFAEYQYPEIGAWRDACIEAATQGFPKPLRDKIPVNVTVPVVEPEQAYALVVESGCKTAKVKVAETGTEFAADIARVEAVRDALGSAGKLRVDVNGAWSLDTAFSRLRELARFDLEYAEQPCASVDELALLRRKFAQAGIEIPIAADESIRRSDDPLLVAKLEAADIAVFKVQPLGGVRRCLELAERIG
ncbi:MAG: o-succinylbenzoate synthase, partial [Propionibacteriaceae bacterium]|nr:o-succinylbenzoate synthase [Propionibacteriaceae bacterium]